MPGTTDMSGRYRMLRRIAGGGMGEVYLAAASGPAGFVKLAVVKRILPHFASDPEFVAMFKNEARLAAALDHPNIVRVYDFGEAQGNFFYAMEYLHGDSLASLLPRLAASKERLSLAHALTIGLGISAGLHFAHEWRGPDGKPLHMVHRDVSPANVFVTTEGEVKLLDFGIAKVMSATAVTRDGTRKGKVPYMSPEQCIGEPLDRRSDVFALGILLYEMTTMSRLFRADNEFSTMNMITFGEVPPPSSRVPDYPPALEAVVLRALKRDTEQRYPTALALHEDLERVAAELGLRTSPLALGRLVRTLVDERPVPSIEAPAQADEPQTAVFFAALNEALTVREALPVTAPIPASVSAAPTSPSVEITVEGSRRRRGLVIGALALAGVSGLVWTWQTRSSGPGEPAVAAPAEVVRPAAPQVAAPAAKIEAVPAEPAPAAVVVAPVQPSEPPASPRPRKRIARKANVLDSMRPSK